MEDDAAQDETNSRSRMPPQSKRSGTRMPPQAKSSGSGMPSAPATENQARPGWNQGAIHSRTSDEIANEDEDVANYDHSSGEEMEDRRECFERPEYDGEADGEKEEVQFTYTHKKGDNDEYCPSCFGRTIPNGTTASLPQFLSYATDAYKSYTKCDSVHGLLMVQTIEKLCDTLKSYSRSPGTPRQAVYLTTAESLRDAIEYCIARIAEASIAMKTFTLLYQFIEATMGFPLKPMSVFRQENDVRHMFQICVLLAESSNCVDSQFEESLRRPAPLKDLNEKLLATWRIVKS